MSKVNDRMTHGEQHSAQKFKLSAVFSAIFPANRKEHGLASMRQKSTVSTRTIVHTSPGTFSCKEAHLQKKHRSASNSRLSFVIITVFLFLDQANRPINDGKPDHETLLGMAKTEAQAIGTQQPRIHKPSEMIAMLQA